MSDTIKIDVDKIQSGVSFLEGQLEEIERVKSRLMNDIKILGEQTSPNTMKQLEDSLKKFKKDLGHLSTEQIKETLDGLSSGIEEFRETDEDIAAVETEKK